MIQVEPTRWPLLFYDTQGSCQFTGGATDGAIISMYLSVRVCVCVLSERSRPQLMLHVVSCVRSPPQLLLTTRMQPIVSC